jgi:hypothetical protein
MKKVKMLFMSLAVCLSLGGCMGKVESRGEQLTKLMGTEQEMSDQIMQEIVEALDAGDAEALKQMFSKSSLEETVDLDQQIEKLMSFYQGKKVSYKGDASSNTKTHDGVEIKEFIGRYYLVTTEESYVIEYDHKPVDDSNSEEIGLRKLEFVTDKRYKEEADVKGYYDWKHYDNGPGIYIQDDDV